MKVGILSMQRVINYGSFLQAYALKKIITQLGHSVEFIDIETVPKKYDELWPLPPEYRINRLKALLHRLAGHKRVFLQMSTEQDAIKYYHKLYTQYPRLWKKYLDMDSVSNVHMNYDALVIGSDEVFNCAQESSWGQTMKLFGQGFNGKYLVSYAASFAQTTEADLERLKIRENVVHRLNCFSDLSVRDKHSEHMVQSLTGRHASIHLDPVLIYGFPEVKTGRKTRRTLIIYAYPNRICEPELIQAILSFADKKKVKIVSIGAYYEWAENPVMTPFEVLKAFQEAMYIVTDTFHGTIFSLKYQKQFAAVVRSSNENKLMDLLSRFHVSDRAVNSSDELEEILKTPYDYEEVKAKIVHGQEQAISYLREALPNVLG